MPHGGLFPFDSCNLGRLRQVRRRFIISMLCTSLPVRDTKALSAAAISVAFMRVADYVLTGVPLRRKPVNYVMGYQGAPTWHLHISGMEQVRHQRNTRITEYGWCIEVSNGENCVTHFSDVKIENKPIGHDRMKHIGCSTTGRCACYESCIILPKSDPIKSTSYSLILVCAAKPPISKLQETIDLDYLAMQSNAHDAILFLLSVMQELRELSRLCKTFLGSLLSGIIKTND